MGGPSKCSNCTLEIKGHHSLPVLSWFHLRGRCRYCKINIPFTYVLFEAGLGFALVAVWGMHFGFGLEVLQASAGQWSFFLRDVFFTLVLTLLFLSDYVWQLLPDKITFPAILIALVWNLGLGHDWQDLLLGGAVVGGFFFLQYAISRGRWIGGGDIRMGVLLGVLLGLVGGIEALFLAYILGASIAIVMLLSGMATRKTMIPFGTFLALAGFVVMLWGEQLLEIVL